MDAIKRMFKFGLGGALGAVIGVGVASLLAPQKGEDLQRSSRSFIDEVKVEGDRAQRETEARLAEKFRIQVNDSSALTGETTHAAPKAV
ncbi:MAG TPA: YtxH domain-containing protein [Thermomicrobiales bacterium]|nr:YtxH domain-containing protein [Thermomicrobiales bacterium]